MSNIDNELPPTVKEVFDETVKVAGVFLDDGAIFSAAGILRRLADRLERHGHAVNEQLEKAGRQEQQGGEIEQ
ncbi:hypothetical protein HDIA_2247 [Hartmannibacter diazotrophicus]|uniref:Uncharacterized protein n=1 Tax=Hartmannibacter diazotrophicus TaxID=1482074 RepID=A0A2C9D6L6_9HYPH|nr:hypothetical protein [Hartmannibacter diazotrophicus]SON55788.1 hypothetical protein HDIA_2247 [Hartmannibacter diazotrophicus]